MAELRPDLPRLPARLAALPVDERGYPVPWFVAWIDGKPDFRVIGPGKREEAIRFERCWVCGQKLGSHKAFVIGPMCAVNRVSSEPPCHQECAVWSAKACPFLTRPKAHRRETDIPAGTVEPDGCGIDRNPGVALVWTTKRYGIVPDGRGGWLVDVGEPIATLWFAEGREATRAEVEASITSGFPVLEEMAKQDGPKAIAQLAEQLEQAMKLLPAEVAHG